jgi:LysR family hydrogen peroxide-inducible transcriptional activator
LEQIGLKICFAFMLVTIRQLQYIVSVADHKSFSKGAEACFAEQSTVSHQVKLVEERLGIHIFKKKSQPIEVTTEGVEVVKQAREILEKVEELIRPFKSVGKKHQDPEVHF